MRLYHSPGSRSARVLWTLEEVGASYELTFLTLKERRGEEHRQRHPLGRVPVLELDDGTMMFESAAILVHLGDIYPGAGLAPPLGSPGRPALYQWTVFAVAELEPSIIALRRARSAGQDEADQAKRFNETLAALDRALSDRPWLLGDDFTVADVLGAMITKNAFDRGLVDEFGGLRAYVERAFARPAGIRAEQIGAARS